MPKTSTKRSLPQVPDVAPPAVAPAAVILEDDDAEQIKEVERKRSDRAGRDREDALLAEYTWEKWDDREQGWVPYRLVIGLDRWTWWHRMELHNAPIPSEAWNDIAQWGDAHVPTAWSLLYLCSTDPDTILSLVPRPQLYWYAVNEWAKVHCPGEKWASALTLMRQMEQQMKLTIAMPRPTRAKRGRLGNVPCP